MKEQQSVTVDIEGEELAKVIIDHWHVGCGATMFLEEVVDAHRATGVSLDDIAAVTKAIDERRGYEFGEDQLGRAYVPKANMRAVCNLLDQIQELCTPMW